MRSAAFLLIANRVWRCNMTFTVIIAAAKMHKQGRRSEPVRGCRSPSRSCIYTGGVIHGLRAVPLRCIHILEAVIPPAVSLASSTSSRRPRRALPAPIFSLAAGTRRIAYFCAHRVHRVLHDAHHARISRGSS